VQRPKDVRHLSFDVWPTQGRHTPAAVNEVEAACGVAEDVGVAVPCDWSACANTVCLQRRLEGAKGAPFLWKSPTAQRAQHRTNQRVDICPSVKIRAFAFEGKDNRKTSCCALAGLVGLGRCFPTAPPCPP
jgi:hypothetical protein